MLESIRNLNLLFLVIPFECKLLHILLSFNSLSP
jgi:hypothetical protein